LKQLVSLRAAARFPNTINDIRAHRHAGSSGLRCHRHDCGRLKPAAPAFPVGTMSDSGPRTIDLDQ